jgi:AraC-like DNA-binding protein
MLWVMEKVEAQVFLVRPESRISFGAGAAIFLPPFRMVEWLVGPGEIQFSGYASIRALPSDLPTEPILFPIDRGLLPATLESSIEAIRQRATWGPVCREGRPAAPARRAKQIIDARFREPLGIKELSEKLGCTHSVLTRYFRQSYGVAPVQYRNKLRLFEAQRLILMESSSVTEAAMRVGFGEVSKFNKLFKRLFKVTPTSFKIRTAHVRSETDLELPQYP